MACVFNKEPYSSRRERGVGGREREREGGRGGGGGETQGWLCHGDKFSDLIF